MNFSGETIYFEQCTFLLDFTIISIFVFSLRFESCRFEKSLIFEDCKIRFLSFIKVEATNGINISAGEILKITIDPLNESTHFSFIGKFLLIQELNINSTSGITAFSKNCIINRMYISGYYNNNSRLNFIGIKNVFIQFMEVNNDGKIYFSNLKPVGVATFAVKPIANYIELYDQSTLNEDKKREVDYIKSLNQNDDVLKLIKSDASVWSFGNYIENNHYLEFLVYQDLMTCNLNIIDSSAGVLEMKNIMLDRYNFELKNSDLSSIKLINSKIPLLNLKDDYLNYYYIYNDLYTSASNQNNTKDKIDYYRISQKFLYKFYLSEAKTTRDYGSIISIGTSRLFSNHGTNWIKAVFFTVFFSFVFFCLFVNNIKGVYFDPTLRGFYNFKNNILPFFPESLNPLHRLDYMEPLGKYGTWARFIDLIGRIAVGVGVFDIVRSFRKHVR